MAVEWLRAQCRCDRCLKVFLVEVDTAEEISSILPSIFDVVEEAVRGGGGMGGSPTSVVKDDNGDNEMLCAGCTAINDAEKAA